MTTDTETTTNAPVTAQDLTQVIAELQEYRERLLKETLETAQKAKMQKKVVMAQLEPELAQIDAILENLRQQEAMLVSP
jgi:hypothetical protein